MKFTVLVAAGRSTTRSSLLTLLETEPHLDPVGAAPDLPSAIHLLRSLQPNLLLVDRSLLGDAGLRRLPMLKAESEHTAIVVVGMGDHPGMEKQAREAGAVAYIRLDEAAERVASVAETIAL